MVQKKRRNIGLFSLLGACILLSFISIQLTDGLIYNTHSDNNIINNEELKTSIPPTYEINTFSIKIDNVNPNEEIDYHTWDWWVANYDWCTKSGNVYYIKNVELSGGYYIAIVDSNVNFIVDNCKVYESNHYGIKLQNTDNGKLLNNNFSYNAQNGIHLERDCYYNEIGGNDISHNSLNGIYLVEVQTSYWDLLQGTTYYYHPCNYNKIIENTITFNSESGISVDGYDTLHKCKNNTIKNNVATDNDKHGIYLSLSNLHEITNNTCNTNGASGIYLSYSNENSISDNTANANIFAGIYLKNCDTAYTMNNIISYNQISSNKYGIHLFSSNYNRVGTSNRINGNTNYGIYLSEGSKKNTISGNIVNDNLQYDICYESDDCADNTFENNGDVNVVNLASPNLGDTGNGNEFIYAIITVGFFGVLISSIGYVTKTKKKKTRAEAYVDKNIYNRPRTAIQPSRHVHSNNHEHESSPKHIAQYEFYCSACDKKSIGYQVFCSTCGERMKQPELIPKSDTPDMISCVICHSSTCSSCCHEMNGEGACYEECPYCGRLYHKHCWDKTIKSFGKCGFCLETPPPELIPKSFNIKPDQEIRYTLDN